MEMIFCCNLFPPVPYSNVGSARSLKLFLLITFTDAYTFIPILVTLAYFQGHMGVGKMKIVFFHFECESVKQLPPFVLLAGSSE